MIWPRRARTGTVAFVAIVVFVGATTATARAQQDPTPASSSTSTPPPPSTTASTTAPAPPSSTAIPSTTTPPSSTTVPPVPDTSAPSTTTPAAPDTIGSVSAQAVPAGAANEVFARGSDGALWWRQLTTAGWSLWQSFGGGVIGTPAAVAESGGCVSAFVRGTDGALYRRRYDGTTWSGWTGFGGLLTSDPVVWSNATGVYVFASGGDGALYWGKFTAGDSWSGYRRLGGAVSGRPAVAEDSSGLYVFVVGADRAVWVQRFVNDVPGGFVGLGGGVSFGLTAGVDSTGATVYVRGTDGGPYRRRSIGGGTFAPWQPLGGYLTSVPAVTGNGPTSRLFARGGDNALYVQTITNGSPQGWQSLGGVITSNPAADLGHEWDVRSCVWIGWPALRARGGSKTCRGCEQPRSQRRRRRIPLRVRARWVIRRNPRRRQRRRGRHRDSAREPRIARRRRAASREGRLRREASRPDLGAARRRRKRCPSGLGAHGRLQPPVRPARRATCRRSSHRSMISFSPCASTPDRSPTTIGSTIPRTGVDGCSARAATSSTCSPIWPVRPHSRDAVAVPQPGRPIECSDSFTAHIRFGTRSVPSSTPAAATPGCPRSGSRRSAGAHRQSLTTSDPSPFTAAETTRVEVVARQRTSRGNQVLPFGRCRTRRATGVQLVPLRAVS